MMNQLLLVQVLTEGAEATQSSSALPWGTWIPSVIGLLGSLVVAWWSGRKIDKQMELSKQATPPELTRYKTWLEVSEIFKKLEGFKDTGALADSKEYQEIEASRKVALERAVWERKVFSFCPNINAQKLLMQINPSKIFRIVNSSRDERVSSSDIYVHLSFKPYLMCLSAWVLLWIACTVYLFVNLGNGDRNGVISSLIGFVYLLILIHFFWSFLPDGCSGVLEANYYFRKIIISRGQKFEINIVSESDMMVRRLMMSVFDSNYSDIVHCPWEGRNKIIVCWMKIVIYFFPRYYVKKGFKNFVNKEGTLWGSYKELDLNGDLKEKLGCKDNQALNFDIQKESQPTPSQG